MKAMIRFLYMMYVSVVLATVGLESQVVRKVKRQTNFDCAAEIDLRVCTIFSLKEPEALLHHHIRHWTEVLDVPQESMHYVLQLPPPNEQTFAEEVALSIFKQYGVPRENVIPFRHNYTNSIQKELFENCTRDSFARIPAKGAAWVSWSDSDELPVIPRGKGIQDEIKTLQCRGITLYAGYMVDRVAANGALPDINAETDIFSQFPLTCAMTTKILGAYATKMIAFARPCLTDCYSSSLGSHHTSMFEHGGKCACACEPRANWGQVAHFKWNSQLISKLQWRVDNFKPLSGSGRKKVLDAPQTQNETFWWWESNKMLRYLHETNGRISKDECFSLDGPNHLVSKHIGLTEGENSKITCDKPGIATDAIFRSVRDVRK